MGIGISHDMKEYLEYTTAHADAKTVSTAKSLDSDTDRALASVQRISSLHPVIFQNDEGQEETASNIELARVMGWDVIVKKNKYTAGELVVFYEIGSVPPDIPVIANDLWPDKDARPRKLRLKTKRFKGVLSQGYVTSLDDVKSLLTFPNFQYSEGCDLTAELGVIKYQNDDLAQKSKDIAGEFIDGVPKTDEKRVQSNMNLHELLTGKPYYITVKLDGKSTTVAMYDDKLTVASRNYRLKEDPNNEYWAAVNKTGIADLVFAYPNFAVQGELCGPSIQNNRLALSEKELFIFDIYDRQNDCYLPFEQIALFSQKYGFKHVPLLDRGDRFWYPLSELLRLAEGKYPGTDNHREGIVIRSREAYPRISFKVINNEYLLAGGE